MSLSGRVANKLKRLATDQHYRRIEHLLWRVARRPRHTPGFATIGGRSIEYIDSASFVAMAREIFRDEFYLFSATSPTPRILDCGANIGLASLFWKQRWPNSRITAFEADGAIASLAARNLEGLDVEVIPAAVWTVNGLVSFRATGDDAGRVAAEGGTAVDAVRLRDYLDEPVDMLKVDIEGAEVDVLLDCAEELANVGNIFVEYHSPEDRPQRLGALLQLLEDSGFRLQVSAVRCAAQPFVARGSWDGFDVQLNIFGTRPAEYT